MNKRFSIVFCLVILLILPAGTPVYGEHVFIGFRSPASPQLWRHGSPWWDEIVGFGDSLSDNGPADGYGSFIASNGPVWLDYLAASMRDVELEDRAICGAQTDGPKGITEEGYTFDIGMKQQVSNYIDSLPADADLSRILYTIWIGGNDFLALNPGEPVEPVIIAAINNIYDALQALVLAGAEDILVMNLPDLGLTPFIQSIGYSDEFTSASMVFNTYLAQAVCELGGLFPQVNFYMADTFELLQYAVENGESLGFTNVDGICEGLDSCDGYLFYDGIHPTTYTHKYIAALAVGQVKMGYVSTEIRTLLKDLRVLQPRKPFIVQCGD